MLYMAEKNLSEKSFNELKETDINYFKVWLDKLICLWGIENMDLKDFKYHPVLTQESDDFVIIISLSAVFVTIYESHWEWIFRDIKGKKEFVDKLYFLTGMNSQFENVIPRMFEQLQKDGFTLCELIALIIQYGDINIFNNIFKLKNSIAYIQKYYPEIYQEWENGNQFRQKIGLINIQHEEFKEKTKTFHEEYRFALDDCHELFFSFSDIYYKMEQLLDEIKKQLQNNTEVKKQLQNNTEIKKEAPVQIISEDDWYEKCQELFPLYYDDLKQSTYKETFELCTNLTKLVDFLELSVNIVELYNCEELDLCGKGYHSLPNEISCLDNLKKLLLMNNNLTEIPEGVTKLKNITHLIVKMNHIKHISNVCQMTTLTYLSLGHNLITDIPSKIDQLVNLKTLNVAYNQLRTLPVELGNLKNLNLIICNHNPFREIPIKIRDKIHL